MLKPFESDGLKGAREEAWKKQTRLREFLLKKLKESEDEEVNHPLVPLLP